MYWVVANFFPKQHVDLLYVYSDVKFLWIISCHRSESRVCAWSCKSLTADKWFSYTIQLCYSAIQNCSDSLLCQTKLLSTLCVPLSPAFYRNSVVLMVNLPFGSKLIWFDSMALFFFLCSYALSTPRTLWIHSSTLFLLSKCLIVCINLYYIDCTIILIIIKYRLRNWNPHWKKIHSNFRER